MPHRDALTAAMERISALERELLDARLRDAETVPEVIDRLHEEKRALQAERARLVVERDRLLEDLGRARNALAKAEETAAKARSELAEAEASNVVARAELKEAITIRDQLRRQAVEEATRAAQSRREGEGRAPTERPPSDESFPRARPEANGLPTLYAHNRRTPAKSANVVRAGVACPTCHATGAHDAEMVHVRLGPPLEDLRVSPVMCPRCGFVGMKRGV